MGTFGRLHRRVIILSLLPIAPRFLPSALETQSRLPNVSGCQRRSEGSSALGKDYLTSLYFISTDAKIRILRVLIKKTGFQDSLEELAADFSDKNRGNVILSLTSGPCSQSPVSDNGK
ncbi:hypothetical protein Y1Q_0007183 [Alligator mississippiensis]|uniref:Uncharacterized protein n=1 Tax=Alligator mississippiensis TaxID=8496 RepID=A0A151N6J8_ALLMI|nr:hypothetical protein Y1Q_0007183 [Alligator mississippiensis]